MVPMYIFPCLLGSDRNPLVTWSYGPILQVPKTPGPMAPVPATPAFATAPPPRSTMTSVRKWIIKLPPKASRGVVDVVTCH